MPHVTSFARQFHRASDAAYQRMDVSLHPGHSRATMAQFPKTVRQVLATTVTMKVKGYTPFVHALPAASNVLMKFFEAERPCPPDFKYLRSPLDPRFQCKPNEVPRLGQSAQSSHHVSLGYALLSGTNPLETAADFGFTNHRTLPVSFLVEEWDQFLRDTKIKTDSIAFCYFKMKGIDLIHKYASLPVGEFLILGIQPERVDQLVYDSHPYNHPSGNRASEVAAHPERFVDQLRQKGTHMATLPIHRESNTPDSGMIGVLASKSLSFTKDVSMTPMEQVPELASWVQPPTEKEASFEQEKEKLDQELDMLVEEYRAYQKNPDRSFDLLPSNLVPIRDADFALP